jgi:uncharacterized protein YhjY with autotransporter beta-barrel domain
MKAKSFREGLRGLVWQSLLFLTLAGHPSTVAAADWHSLTQPIGTENTPFLVDPALLNASYGAGKGPWELTTTVTSIKTTVSQSFIRFYNPSAPSNPSGQEGSWVMRRSAVRGLNAEQIRNLFALPNKPTMMTLGVSQVGTSFYTGIAGPIDGWGEGGGQQSQANGGPYTTFFNGQSIMDAVLSYPSMANSDNGRTIGTYLVSHTPQPYSDMESVYNNLDVLYNPASQELFNSGLNSMTPQRFDNLAASGYQAAIMQNQAIDDRIDRLVLNRSKSGIWAKAARTIQHDTASGYDGDINGFIVGGDTKSSENTVTGMSLAWMHGTVDWYDDGGHAVTNYYRAAAYSALVLDQAFLQILASAGSADGNTSRNINIGTFYLPSPHGPALSPLTALSRTATAAYNGWDAGVGLRSGLILHSGPLKLLPGIGLDYLYQSRNGFSETGAESLDLQVEAAHTETVHCLADLLIEREFQLNDHKKITPYLIIGWGYEQRLDAQAITASMNGWSDSFTTTSSLGGTNTLMGSAGLEMAVSKSLFIQADYFYQARNYARQSGFSGAMRYEF